MGPILHGFISRYLDEHTEAQAALLAQLGASKESPEDKPARDLADNAASEVREIVADALSIRLGGATFSREAPDGECTTPIRAELLRAWARAAADPAAPVTEWLISGAPAGISQSMPELQGLFPPRLKSEPQLDPDALESDYLRFVNHAGLEEDNDAVELIHGFRDKGYLREFDTLEQCREYLGADPILSKFGCVTRERINSLTGEKSVKKRIILDPTESLVTAASARTFRIVLPRVTDAIHGTLQQCADLAGDEQVEFFVMDVEDAFWLIPLLFKERVYFVGKLRGKYLVFLRTAQGSRAAPTTWGAVMSMAARCVQSLFLGRQPERARFNVYVDDPIASIIGTKPERDRSVAIIVLGWRILGFPLSTPKAKRGPQLVWIGATLHAQPEQVTASIPPEKLEELANIIRGFLSRNVIPRRELASFAGKANSIASLIYLWRPFLGELWGAMADRSPSDAPPGCVWTRQVLHTLRGLMASSQGRPARYRVASP